MHISVISHISARAKPLVFPSLIFELCKEYGVRLTGYPVNILKPSINKAYILTHCTNPIHNQVPWMREATPTKEEYAAEQTIHEAP